MTESYQQARRWADKFLSRQQRQLSKLLNVPLAAVTLTDAQADMDGVDVTIHQVRFGLRVRRAPAIQRFGIQAMFRTSKGRDGLSELDKIKLGRLDYMLLNYATDNASQDNDDDSVQASVLLDLRPFATAAADGFQGVTVTELEADRVHGLAVDLASLMARHGPCVVIQQIVSTTSSTNKTTPPRHPISGLEPVITETETFARVIQSPNPDLLAAARQRVALRSAA